MKKVGMLVLAMVLGLNANGVIFAKTGLMMSDFAGTEQPCTASEAERGGLMMSDRAGLIISDFVSAATASATGIIIVGKSGLMLSDFAGETPVCPE